MFPDFLAYTNIEIGLVPAADRYSGGVQTDVFDMKNYSHAGFLIVQGAIEDAGISNIVTVEACSTIAAAATQAIAFRHRSKEDAAGDWGALTAATTSGYNFNTNHAVANCMHWVEFTADEVNAGNDTGYDFVRLAIAETVNKTVTAGVYFFANARYPQSLPINQTS
jgi:hypothetical protein